MNNSIKNRISNTASNAAYNIKLKSLVRIKVIPLRVLAFFPGFFMPRSFHDWLERLGDRIWQQTDANLQRNREQKQIRRELERAHKSWEDK
ncbi:MAG: hypothetical protein LBO07_07635 [Coriobacteriales bacterium]|jgi:hypothetical protein|nr:hypothetical protein [Coriobacteriales bacterium]